jgi:hypothetical protein
MSKNSKNPINIQIIEDLELIAKRVPPGDRWKIIIDSNDTVYPSLMDTLESYFISTQFKGDFRFSPSNGEIYIIKNIEEEIKPEPPKQYNIYGDPI